MRSKYTPKCRNLLHQKFNKLTAIGWAGRDKHGNTKWLWRCDCGTYTFATADNVTRNKQKGCGCLRHEFYNLKHGALIGGIRPAEYEVWTGMNKRCVNPKHKSYKDYGGRGISICDRWKDFAKFLGDIGPRPSPKHSIERKSVNGNYEPDNCIWALPLVQARNTRRNRKFTVGHETLCLSEWAERSGADPETISGRIERGWDVERAVTTPPRPGNYSKKPKTA